VHVVAASSPSVWAQPGTLGFLVVFGMGVVLFFVFRSMSKHLRKVREADQREAEQAEQAEQAQQSGTDQYPGQAGQGDMRGPGVDRVLSSDYDNFNR
jgi:flagellar biosynthesis/type III secretory pathway M-ring protein FliF/YscJ